jgi:putative sterol carrier protein
VARLYSAEWVEAFNVALAGLRLDELPELGPGGPSIAATDGRFRVTQVVGDGPDGHDITVSLVLEEGRARLVLDGEDGEPGPASDVTISLSYADAEAMARGELDAAAALGEGRVKVRGDLSLLVAAQGVLAAAARVGSGADSNGSADSAASGGD